MVGTQKWSMEEILWVITMVKQGLKDEEIYEKFCGIFKNARHVRGASSIKYCRTGFMKQEEYSQEKYWEDTPGKIGFVLGRYDAGVYNGQVVADVMHHFPTHIWVPHIKPTARCIDFVTTKFSGYTRENPLVEPVLCLIRDGVSPGKIFRTANENGITVDDIYYIMASPTAWDNSTAGASTSQAAPGNGKAGPLIFELSPTDSFKKPTVHGSQHNTHRSSNRNSQLPPHSHGYEYFNGARNQVAYSGVQRGLETSLLNSGYRQGISSAAPSQTQLNALQRRPQTGGLFQPSQQHNMRFQYPQMPQDSQLQNPMAQQRFEPQNLQGYGGEYQSPAIQQNIPGQFHQQNWGYDSTFGGQQRVPEQPRSIFGGYQQTPDLLGQRNYASSSQAGQFSNQAAPGHNMTQAFYGHPQQILTQEFQQSAIPVAGYENIDPALLGMCTNQAPLPDSSTMTLSQPPLTPRIAPQDLLHPFAYSGMQSGQDVSPLTIENPQFPVTLPPTPEVAAHDGVEHRGQSIIPDPFARGSVLTEQAKLGLGTRLGRFNGMGGFDQDVFDRGLTLSSDTTLGHENSSESIYSVLGIPDQRADQKNVGEGSIANQAGQNSFQSPNSILRTTLDEAVASTPIADQEPISEDQSMELDILDGMAEYGELFELFPDLQYQNIQGFNFNYDESMIGSGAISPFQNGLSKNNPGEHGPPEKWPCDNESSLGAMEVLSRSLETEMAGPFLTQNSSGDNDVSGGIQSSDSGVFENDWAPEGTCCAHHQNFECYFEVPDSDGENATVEKH
ncbi:hypothetical protein V501_07882 [Pseudogymnoascus sp. VKM F-4519 (FW-2642)]|nr:hypothetical protein V501_07882 [Pseudogymnoascus sp. VKM F-4519 (FW-2642)]